MAHSLGLEVIAEGADCDEQVEVLVKIGCDAVQGFAFAAAMPEREFAALLGSSAGSSSATGSSGRGGRRRCVRWGGPGKTRCCRLFARRRRALRRAGRDRELAAIRAGHRGSSAELRVLVVDDGTARLGLLAMRLNRIGATAFYASDVDEGLLFAAEQGPRSAHWCCAPMRTSPASIASWAGSQRRPAAPQRSCS